MGCGWFFNLMRVKGRRPHQGRERPPQKKKEGGKMLTRESLEKAAKVMNRGQRVTIHEANGVQVQLVKLDDGDGINSLRLSVTNGMTKPLVLTSGRFYMLKALFSDPKVVEATERVLEILDGGAKDSGKPLDLDLRLL